MKEKLFFSEQTSWKDKFLSSKEKQVFNFLNSHDLYFFEKEAKFRETFNENSVNFIDGSVISLFLSLKRLKRVRRITGPNFTKVIFNEKIIPNGKKQLFIGLGESDLDKLLEKHSHLSKKDLFCYNPQFIREIEFPEEEILKIAKIINSEKIEYVWVGIGCPKQNILTHKLFQKTRARVFLNVGAALDFLLGKKKVIPRFFSVLGLDWLYRLITDFNHSKKKVIRSFVAIKYLFRVGAK